MSIKLEEYTLIYEITSLPYLIFIKAVPANVIYDLSDLEIPAQIKSNIFECRFIVFDSKGNCINFISEMCSYTTIKSISQTVPLKMINELKEKGK